VRIPLGRREIGVSEHFLNRPQVGPALQQVGGEGVAEEVGVDATRLQAGGSGEASEDEEGSRPGERTALGVEEELRAPAAVEVRAATGEIAAERVGGLAADRNHALLRPLPEATDEPAFEIDRGTVEPDGLAHP
jgi:hypothetical protein